MPAPAAPAAALTPEQEAELSRIRAAIEAGRIPEALAATRELEAALAAQAPLEVADGQILAAPAEAIGMYRPAPQGRVSGPEIYLYAAVRNFGARRLSGGGYEVHLVSDLVVLDASGAELARDTGFGESRFVTRHPQRDTFVNIVIASRGLPPGRYTIRLVIHDKVSNKSGEVSIPVTVP